MRGEVATVVLDDGAASEVPAEGFEAAGILLTHPSIRTLHMRRFFGCDIESEQTDRETVTDGGLGTRSDPTVSSDVRMLPTPKAVVEHRPDRVCDRLRGRKRLFFRSPRCASRPTV
jgi:hypothetical protein